MKNCISKENGISPSVIVIIANKTIAKTTSGKISRSMVKNLYLKKELQIKKEVRYEIGEEVEEEEKGSRS